MTTLSPSGERALNNFIKETVEARKIPGFILGVSNIDGEIYFQGGGVNVAGDPASGEVNPDSVFWICSQTKMIAALATLKLVEQGQISFDTPLGDYLPEFRNPIVVDRTSTQKTTFRPAETVVTVKHVLNFSSGLFYPVVRQDLHGLSDGYTSKEMHASQDPVSSFLSIVIGELPALPLKFEPGTDFVYAWSSKRSSDVLGFLVERVSGKTLEEFCKEHIFGPLGMESSFYLTPALKKRLVDLTFRGEDGSLNPWANQVQIMERDPEKVRLHLGGVGLYSSMRDYLKLLRHLMQINAGRPVANPILNEETVRQIFVPALAEKGSQSLSEFVMVPGTQWGTALAICTEDWPKRRRKGSVFWGGWAGTAHFIDPTSGIAVVFGIQITPSGDIEVVKVWSKLEALLYSALSSGSEKL
ncbi:beta-lactamase [Flammula alnicola]|nr:beta-lactamase [Flammula alnicola]